MSMSSAIIIVLGLRIVEGKREGRGASKKGELALTTRLRDPMTKRGSHDCVCFRCYEFYSCLTKEFALLVVSRWYMDKCDNC